MNDTARETAKKLKADVVIMGGGPAGLSAAVAAAEAGAKNIVLVEAMRSLGGNGPRAFGVFAVESPAQKRAGEDYSKDQAFFDKMNSVGWQVDPYVMRTLINVSGKCIEWLESKGLVFECVNFCDDIREGVYRSIYHIARPIEIERAPRSGNFPVFDEDAFQGERKVGQVFGVEAIIETLYRECKKLGVKIITGYKGKSLLTDKDGKVSGLLAVKRNEEEEIEITAESVILAGGGFPHNKELMERFFPRQTAYGVYSLSVPTNKGEGLLMAEKAGAIIDDCVNFFDIGPHHYPYGHILGGLVRRPEPISVNKLGERFADESLYTGHQHHYGTALQRQPDGRCYALLDTPMLNQIIERRELMPMPRKQLALIIDFQMSSKQTPAEPFAGLWDELERDKAKGMAKVADTWDEIAQFIGCRPEALKSTVEQYNTYCENGYDKDLLKPKEWLVPLRKPPFYAIVGRSGFDVTFGGIKINPHMEVISKQYKPISGLYAAGTSAGSTVALPYHTKFAGTSCGFAIYTGYIAGKEAAKHAIGSK